MAEFFGQVGGVTAVATAFGLAAELVFGSLDDFKYLVADVIKFGLISLGVDLISRMNGFKLLK